MTKRNRCVTIIVMKKNLFVKSKFLLIIFALVFAITGICFASFNKPAKAETFEEEVLLPLSKSEVFDFNGKILKDAIAFKNGYALICGNELWIYKNNEYNKCSLKENLPNQIKLLSDNKLVVLDKNHLYVVDTQTLNYTPIKYNDISVTASFFDLSGNYLVTKSGSDVFLYTLNSSGQILTTHSLTDVRAKNDSYIAVDQDGTVYYIADNGKLNRYSNQTSTPLATYSDYSNMVTNNGTAYFIADKKIFRVNTNDSSISALSCNENSNYDLGGLKNPNSLSFYNNYLLVCDQEIGAIQQFEIVENTLNFTGFAIAKNKTAFNRTGENILDVQRNNGVTAFLTDEKIMIYFEKDNYAEKNFVNLFPDSFNGTTPQCFALGEGYLTVASNNNVWTYRINTKEISEITFPDIVKDVCYQSGYFYFLTGGTSQSSVYKFGQKELDKENQLNVTQNNLESFLLENYRNANLSKINVDVFGNVYTFDNPEIIKVESDLCGNLFALTENSFLKYNKNSQKFKTEKSYSEGLTSFYLNFEKKEVVFTRNSSEFAYLTESLSNIGINGTALPNDFVLTDYSAKENPKFCKVNANANVYSVDYSDNIFTFKSLAETENEYVVICKSEQLNHYVLACKNGIVLAHEEQIDFFEPSFINQDKTVYVSTDVSGYYLPAITDNNALVLENNVRLSKGTVLNTIKLLSLSERQFYLASFQTENGQTRTGYIPVEFTAEKLSEHYEYKGFTVEKVKNCNVYSDTSLKTAVDSLDENEEIRVYGEENGILTIKYFKNGTWNDGFIQKSNLKTPEKAFVRNVLIILSVITGSVIISVFFLLKKKKS